MTKMMQMQDELRAWIQKNFPLSGGLEALGLLGEEVGELMRCLVKREQEIRGSREFWTAELRKELGDVVIAATQIAEREGWYLEDVAGERWLEVQKRDWTGEPQETIDVVDTHGTVIHRYTAGELWADCACREHGMKRCCPVHPVHVWPHVLCSRTSPGSPDLED